MYDFLEKVTYVLDIHGLEYVKVGEKISGWSDWGKDKWKIKTEAEKLSGNFTLLLRAFE